MEINIAYKYVIIIRVERLLSPSWSPGLSVSLIRKRSPQTQKLLSLREALIIFKEAEKNTEVQEENK